MQVIEKQVITERINLNLGGESKISIDALIDTLEATKRGLRELAANLYEPKTTELEIYVEPFKQGSFDIDIAVKLAAIAGGLWPVLIPLGKAFVKTLFVRKKTKGEETPVTFNGNNNVFIIHTGTGDINLEPEIFKAMTGKNAYEKETQAAFKNLDKDHTRSDLTITVDDGRTAPISETIRKEEMIHLSKPLNLTKNLVTVKQDTNKVWLTVEKPTFIDGQDKWSFSFNGEIFDARILDNNFLEAVAEKRVFFGKGTTIECDLEITEITEPGKKTKLTRVIGKVHTIKQTENITPQSFDL